MKETNPNVKNVVFWILDKIFINYYKIKFNVKNKQKNNLLFHIAYPLP